MDISVAVATPKGLVVPVLRNVQEMNYADIEVGIAQLGEKAKNGMFLNAADLHFRYYFCLYNLALPCSDLWCPTLRDWALQCPPLWQQLYCSFFYITLL